MEPWEKYSATEESGPWTQYATAEPPSALAVAGNAAAKGIAGTIDMFGNAPTNAFNLGQGVIGATAEALGHPEVWADRTYGTPPNFAQKGMTALGLIKPENEPQTAGQRILDMAVQSGVGMAASPAAGVAGVAKNIGLGMASGVAAGATKEATDSDLAATAVGMAVPLLAHAAVGSKANAPTLANPVKTATLKEAQAAGYVVPPAQVKPSATTNRLESFAGKAAVRQDAAIRNQEVTNNLAAQSIGVPPGTPIEQGISTVRQTAGMAYDAVANLSPTAKSTLDKLREVRQQATLYFKHYDRSADPASLTKAKNLNAESYLLERSLEREAKAAGRPELVPDLKQARTLIAKTHDVERALNLGDGNVDARVIGRMLDQGRPLSGELKVIGKFAQAFGSVSRAAASVPAPGVSALDAAMMVGLGTAGFYGSDDPRGALLGALPLLRGPARAALLSKGYQSRLLAEPPALNDAMLKSLFSGRAIAEAQ